MDTATMTDEFDFTTVRKNGIVRLEGEHREVLECRMVHPAGATAFQPLEWISGDEQLNALIMLWGPAESESQPDAANHTKTVRRGQFLAIHDNEEGFKVFGPVVHLDIDGEPQF